MIDLPFGLNVWIIWEITLVLIAVGFMFVLLYFVISEMNMAYKLSRRSTEKSWRRWF